MGIPDEPEYASIDVDVYGEAVSDLEKTHSGIADHILGLKTDFAYFGVSTSNLNKLEEAKTDLDEVLPGLRRRHSLALQLLGEQQEQGWAGDGVISFQGDLLNDDFASVEEAQQAGEDAASLVPDDGSEIPEEVYEQLEKYGHDPDFAEAFINSLSPSQRGFLLIESDNAVYNDDDTGPQLAVANVFATASFRITYDETFISEINDAMLNHDPPLHPEGIRIGERLIALAQHGTWDHETLVTLAETVTTGDYDTIGNFRDTMGIVTALSRNPRAAAEYMAADPDRTWTMSAYIPTGVSTDEWDAAFADFLTAATVDSEGIYARLGLYDDGQVNVAENNATYWVNKFADEAGDNDRLRFGDQTRGAFADIIEHYWDDVVYSYSSPAGVANNPHRDGIEISSENWNAFVTEAMRAPDPAARIQAQLQTWYEEAMADTAGAENPAQHEYDRKAIRGMVANFASAWETVLKDYEDDEARTEAFWNKLAGLGVDVAFDPTKAGSTILKESLKGIFTSIIGGAVDGRDMPDLDFDFAGTDQEWTNAATDEYNARRNDDGIPPYDDGSVTWDGDPTLYEELYGGSITDGSGNVLHPSDPEFPRDADGNPDPQSLAAFNEWCKDPAVQVLLHDWNMSSSTEGGG